MGEVGSTLTVTTQGPGGRYTGDTTVTVGAIIGRRAYLDRGKSCGRSPPAATLLAQGAGGKEAPRDGDGLGGGAQVCRCKRGWRVLPNDGPPDIGGIRIAEAVSQALTARSVASAALVCSLLLFGCDSVATRPGD